ncbi:MAG: S41 family peptidase [Planctomycetota bacterium]|nr:S41 family peptidase [Planctomycetota bacterium]
MAVRRFSTAMISTAAISTAVILAALLAVPATAAEPDANQTAKEAIATPSKSDARLPRSDDEYYELFRSFADTLDQVERNYVKEVDRRELMEAAIKGALSKLDPYSSYIGPDEISGFKSSVESQFGGIGIQITIDDGLLKILSPLVGTPAYRAGIQAGDRVLEIEGKSTKGIDLAEAVRQLKGEAGTSVTITVQSALTGKQKTVSLKREIIRVSTVLGDTHKPNDDWEFMLDPEQKIGYIRLTSFSRETAGELKKALKELSEQNMRGLILDLRFNPGGLLTSAIEVCDLFINDGKIVSTKGRNTPERTWEAKKNGTFDDFPMVILVNRYSASASEIVSACLQDHKRAVVIGERTWGKGSVQNVIELEDGKSALKLTTASYQRPNGHNIHRFPDAKETDEWGVKPNDGYELKLVPAELEQLVEYRRKRDILIARLKDGDTEAESTGPKSEEKKPDETKPADEKPAADEKSDEKKPEDKKTGDQSSEDEDTLFELDSTDTKPADEKPAAEEPAKKSAADDSKKSDDEASDPDETDKSDDAPADSEKPTDPDNTKLVPLKKADPKTSPKFVDRQLQKAIDYLNSEIAKAK